MEVCLGPASGKVLCWILEKESQPLFVFASRKETVPEECIDSDVANALLAYLQFDHAPARFMVSNPTTKDAFLKAAEYFCMGRLTELINEWSSLDDKVEICDRCSGGFKWSENTMDSCRGAHGTLARTYHYTRLQGEP